MNHDVRLEAGDKSGSGHYPGRSTYGVDYLPGSSGSGGVSGQWTQGKENFDHRTSTAVGS